MARMRVISSVFYGPLTSTEHQHHRISYYVELAITVTASHTHRVVKTFTKVFGSLAQTLYGSLFKLPAHSSISPTTDTVTISSSEVGTRHSNTKWEELDRWVRSSSLRTALCLRRSWLASFCTFPAQVHLPKLKFVVL